MKMIIYGRCPTMRHLSRTHRVALDWLIERTNLDPKIQIKYVDTKNQLADMLTEGSFIRDEWDHLLPMLNIMKLSMFSCSHSSVSNRKQNAMSKESSGKYFQRRFRSGETKTNEFGVKDLPSAKEKIFRKIRAILIVPGIRIGSELCFIRRQETDAKRQPKPNNVFSREAPG